VTAKLSIQSVVIFVLSLALAVEARSQASQDPKAPVVVTPTLPFPTQMKKTVVFITTNCLHQPTAEERAKTPVDLAIMKPEDRAEWDLEMSGTLTPDRLERMTVAERARLRVDPYLGTGFVVFVPDERGGKDQGFEYLVTNRHVVEPGIEHGKSCSVLGYLVSLNHLGDSTSAPPKAGMTTINPAETWYHSEDPSVDLAMIPVKVPQTEWDIQTIPISMFATREMIQKHEIVEGDPVVFAGLFVQYTGSRRLDPVVRSGSIAMLPEDLMQTTLGTMGNVYLAEAHAFGGNSGSPLFVDINKFKATVGYDYRLLGVVAGEVLESNNFTFQVTTTYNVNAPNNSDVSMIVPADEVRSILYSPPLQSLRDRAFTKAQK
jgi:hypothetical protein